MPATATRDLDGTQVLDALLAERRAADRADSRLGIVEETPLGGDGTPGVAEYAVEALAGKGAPAPAPPAVRGHSDVQLPPFLGCLPPGRESCPFEWPRARAEWLQ